MGQDILLVVRAIYFLSSLVIGIGVSEDIYSRGYKFFKTITYFKIIKIIYGFWIIPIVLILYFILDISYSIMDKLEQKLNKQVFKQRNKYE